MLLYQFYSKLRTAAPAAVTRHLHQKTPGKLRHHLLVFTDPTRSSPCYPLSLWTASLASFTKFCCPSLRETNGTHLCCPPLREPNVRFAFRLLEFPERQYHIRLLPAKYLWKTETQRGKIQNWYLQYVQSLCLNRDAVNTTQVIFITMYIRWQDRGGRRVPTALLLLESQNKLWVGSAPWPRSLYPRERIFTHFTGGWVGSRAGLVGRKFSPHRVWLPDHPGRSHSLYQLSYRAKHI